MLTVRIPEAGFAAIDPSYLHSKDHTSPLLEHIFKCGLPVFLKSIEQRRDQNRQNLLQSRAYHPDHDENENQAWCGEHFLGKGSYGCTGLWNRINENNNVVDRMAVKECVPDLYMWYTPDEWRDRMP